MDKKLFLAMYNFSQKRKGMNSFWLFIANYSSPVFCISYAVIGIYLFLKQEFKIIPVLGIPLLCYLSAAALRKLLRRPRPFTTLSLPVNTKKSKGYSCPSNHAAASLIIACLSLYANASFGVVLLILSLLTGLSRIFAGLHYPADVMLGWILAASFGALYILI